MNYYKEGDIAYMVVQQSTRISIIQGTVKHTAGKVSEENLIQTVKMEFNGPAAVLNAQGSFDINVEEKYPIIYATVAEAYDGANACRSEFPDLPIEFIAIDGTTVWFK